MDMRRAQDARGKIALSKGCLEEIMITALLVPVMYMNLRAQLDHEVTITDASPTGEVVRFSKQFKDPPDRVAHDGARCFHCEGSFEEFGVFPLQR